MIDRALIRHSPDLVSDRIRRKDPSFPVKELISLEHQLLQIQQEVESLRHRKNELAQAGKQGVTDELRKQGAEIGKSLKEKDAHLVELEAKFNELYLRCPNIPDEDLPV